MLVLVLRLMSVLILILLLVFSCCGGSGGLEGFALTIIICRSGIDVIVSVLPACGKP